MGSMLTFIIGMLLAVWIAFHQVSENYRFDMVSDTKNGGVFIIDKKDSVINYCNNKTCTLVGEGALPSKNFTSPSVLATLQNAVIGKPVTLKPGQVPPGMKKNLAAKSQTNEHPDDVDTDADADNNNASDEDEEEDAEGDSEEDNDSEEDSAVSDSDNSDDANNDDSNDDKDSTSKSKKPKQMPKGFDF